MHEIESRGILKACKNRFSDNIARNIMRLDFLLDTNVLVAGLSSRSGASFALLLAAASEQIQLSASATLWLEYESVLKRAEIRKLHHLKASEVDDFLDDLARLVRPVELHFAWRPQLRDPGDEMVLEAAVNGHVDALVTHKLSDFEIAKPRFNLKVWTPAQALKQLEKQP
jgi:putative PIN family toxin of toxin-antitoxin system